MNQRPSVLFPDGYRVELIESEETIRAFQDHGRVSSTLERNVDEAPAVFLELARVGVDYDDVVATLESEGVAKFVQSFENLLQLVAAKGPNTLAAPGVPGR